MFFDPGRESARISRICKSAVSGHADFPQDMSAGISRLFLLPARNVWRARMLRTYGSACVGRDSIGWISCPSRRLEPGIIPAKKSSNVVAEGSAVARVFRPEDFRLIGNLARISPEQKGQILSREHGC